MARRVLFTCFPGYGHLQPLIPLATAFRERGADIAVATGPDLCPRVEQMGMSAHPTGLSLLDSERAFLERFPDADTLTPQRRLALAGQHHFVDIASRSRVPALMRLVERWRPDIVVHDLIEVAGPLAAAAHGLPCVTHGVGLLNPTAELMALLAPAIEALFAEHGVANGSEVIRTGTYLDLCPPSLHSPAPNPFTRVLPVRPTPPAPTVTEGLPALADLPYDVTVHVTLGTAAASGVGADTATQVLNDVVTALRDEPVNLVVTVGPGRPPGLVGPQPPHVVVADYLPYATLLPRVDAVVAHAGAGTLLQTLSQGLPSVLLPQAAEQHYNAAMAAAAGAAVVADTDAVTDALRNVLHDSSFATGARRVQAEIFAMPAPDTVAADLERAELTP